MGRSGRYRIIPVIGTSCLVVGMLLLWRIEPTTPIWLLSLALVIVGLGLGCIFPVVTTAVQNAVPREVLGTATAAGLMFRQVGGSLAVAAFGAIFAARLALALGAEGLPPGEIGPQALQGLTEAARAMVALNVADALRPIFLIAAGIAVVGFLVSLRLEEVPLNDRRVPQGE